MNLKQFSVLFIGAACGLSAWAQNAGLDSNEAKEKTPDFLPYVTEETQKSEAFKKAAEAASGVARDLMDAYATRQTPQMHDTAAKLARRADDIANETLAQERDRVLEFLGIDPQADSALYYFVSWSMPIEMLRSYAIEAMWSGGTLVFKGLPPGMKLGDFIRNNLTDLVYGKGASANISIDPRLFDAYQVSTVPTIVVTTVRANMQCQGVNPVSFEYDKKTLTYDTCPEIDQSRYAKISGAVTTTYALEQFKENGLFQAEMYQKALARGWAEGKKPGKEQVAFQGDWKKIVSPEEQAKIREVKAAILKRQAEGATAPTTPAQ